MSTWTKTPPSEPGHYWIRTYKGMFIVTLHISEHSDRRLEDDDGDPVEGYLCEWWPVPIQPPESQP